MKTQSKRLQRRLISCLLLYIVPALLGATSGVSALGLAATFGLWPGLSRVLRHPVPSDMANRLLMLASALSTSAVAALVCMVTAILGSWCLPLWCLVAVEVAQRKVPRKAVDPSRWLMAY